ncbi:MAG: sirohydrochlorin cobaltochelatase [Verrucomicrobiota bacterium]
MSGSAQEIALAKWVAAGLRRIGQISIEAKENGVFALTHREDSGRNDLANSSQTEDAIELARFDDAGKYRPLKTAPNLRHGWQLNLRGVAELRLGLDHFYPGRLAAFLAWEEGALGTTPLRETLKRQTGMYRAAAQISDDAADALVGNFCKSNGGCLRTILWKRDGVGTLPSTQLPPEKFEPRHDQTGLGETVLPLLCQEACNLLVAAARENVKSNHAP